MSRLPIEARGLNKVFGFAPVLRGIDLEVAAGAGLLIAGGNGAGKSTLLAILAGLSMPSAGVAMLFGTDSRRLSPAARRRVGLLTHQSFLYPNLTAHENLSFFCTLYRIEHAEAVIHGWLERVGLATASDERIRDFSRGMEQRLALARTMLAEPDVLLMDEPFAALDTGGAAMAAAVIAQAMARGCAVAMTAHQMIAPLGLSLDLCELVRGHLRRRHPAAESLNEIAS